MNGLVGVGKGERQDQFLNSAKHLDDTLGLILSAGAALLVGDVVVVVLPNHVVARVSGLSAVEILGFEGKWVNPIKADEVLEGGWA